MIESWFLASTPNSQFITDWKNKFVEILNYPSSTEYVDMLRKNTNIQNIDMPYYLSIHIACQHVLQNSKNKHIYKLSMLDAEKGPLLYRANEWYHLFMPVLLYCKDTISPLVKIRGGERQILDIVGVAL